MIDWDEANHMMDDTGNTWDDRNKANEKMNECRNAPIHLVLPQD